MKFQKCFFCNKIGYTPFHVTEIEDKKVEWFDMCAKCAADYFGNLGGVEPKSSHSTIDISHIKTPEDLLAFIGSMSEPTTTVEKGPCECGTTLKDIEKNGRFGCVNCYDHFEEFMENMVYPFHGANEHVGKVPKCQRQRALERDPDEKMKLLKLRYAKALELEEYEKAAEINKEIEQLLKQSPPSSFSDL